MVLLCLTWYELFKRRGKNLEVRGGGLLQCEDHRSASMLLQREEELAYASILFVVLDGQIGHGRMVPWLGRILARFFTQATAAVMAQGCGGRGL